MTPSFSVPAAAFPDSAPDDPYFSSVKLLLHCDGADGSTTFTDVAGHTVVANGNVQIDTAQSKFGGASAYFPAAGDYLSITTGSEFAFGTGDFTIELWLRLETALGSWRPILSKRSASSPSTVVDFVLEVSPDGQVLFVAADSRPILIYSNTLLVTGTTYHISACRRSGVTSLYIDGILNGSSAGSGNITNNHPLLVGKYNDSATFGLGGWIDDLRITAGVARYAPVPPAIKSDLNPAYSVGYGHTWAEKDRTAFPIVPTWSDEVTVERYPTYAYTGGNYHEIARNGRIAGTLQSAGVPMVDTWVFLTYRLTAQVVAGTRTDALGRFEFTGLYPDAKYLVSAYESRANPPGYNVVNADYITPVLT